MAFHKLVRFELEGSIFHGDLIQATDSGYRVRKLTGNIREGFQQSSQNEIFVKRLLCPLESTPIFLCVGLNYRKHAAEASLEIPEYPVIFTKPADALAGPDEAIPICPDAQSMLDYEGELTVIVGKDCKDLPEDFDLDTYVLGYTAGNDISARNFQLPAAGGGQYCYAKSFDKFAPIGPFIASTKLIPNPQKLSYVTRVNGEVVQKTGTEDMIWSVKNILRHLSRGTTVRTGTVIMTGTPSGVGFFRKKFLNSGDTVEVEIDGFLKLANKIQFI